MSCNGWFKTIIGKAQRWRKLSFKSNLFSEFSAKGEFVLSLKDVRGFSSKNGASVAQMDKYAHILSTLFR